MYDDDGNLRNPTLIDYCVPSAAEVPSFKLDHTVTPSPTNPLGVKGIGEAGTIGSAPAVINAVVDALSPLRRSPTSPCPPTPNGCGRPSRRPARRQRDPRRVRLPAGRLASTRPIGLLGRARRRRQAPGRRPLAAAAHEAAAGHAGGARRHRPASATCRTCAATAAQVRIGALTRHHDVATSDCCASRCRCWPSRRPGRRPAGAPPGHDRRLDRPRRPRRPTCPRRCWRCGARWWPAGPGGEREIAADDFFTGFLETALAPDELLTEIRVPAVPGAGWAFQKFNRRAQDWAIVGVAAVLTNGSSARRRPGQHGLDAAAGRRRRGGAAVRGGGGRRRRPGRRGHRAARRPQRLAEYRRHLARVLVRRALEQAGA